jgi:hypothetical protein
MSKFTIYTQRIGGNGTTYNQEFRCDGYSKDKGIINFWSEKEGMFYIPIYKFDYVQIKEDQVVEP